MYRASGAPVLARHCRRPPGPALLFPGLGLLALATWLLASQYNPGLRCHCEGGGESWTFCGSWEEAGVQAEPAPGRGLHVQQPHPSVQPQPGVIWGRQGVRPALLLVLASAGRGQASREAAECAEHPAEQVEGDARPAAG